nr:MAG TPA: hypothetical protein [Caudoviricetes sp.]
MVRRGLPSWKPLAVWCAHRSVRPVASCPGPA